MTADADVTFWQQAFTQREYTPQIIPDKGVQCACCCISTFLIKFPNQKIYMRFIRILLSTFFCIFLIFTSIGWMTWSEEVNFLHYAYGPWIFITFFLAGIVVPIKVVIVGVLSFLDAKRFKRPYAYMVVWTAVCALFLVKHPLLILFGPGIGFIYWLLVGRVAGKPEINFDNFHAQPFRAKVMFVSFWVYLGYSVLPFIFFLVSSIYISVVPVSLGEPLVTVQFDRDMTIRLNLAMHRFPSAESCTSNPDMKMEPGTIALLDWDKIKRSADEKVCVFRMLSKFGDHERSAEWFLAQGYSVSDSAKSGRMLTSYDGNLCVSGQWSIKNHGPRYPHRFGIKRILAAVPYSNGTTACWSPDGKKLLWVNMSSNTL